MNLNDVNSTPTKAQVILQYGVVLYINQSINLTLYFVLKYLPLWHMNREDYGILKP